MRGSRRAWMAVFALIVAFEAYAFFLKESGEAENIASRSDWHLTGEVAGEAALVQTFVTHADGLDGVDVWAQASSGASGGAEAVPRGPIVFTVTRGDVWREQLARVEVPAAQVIAAQPFHVAIPRVHVSAGRAFVLSITAPEATRGHGVRFVASGPAYPQGALTLGGREEWGDLQFRTTAERTTIYRNLRHLRESASVPELVRSDLFLVLMVLLFNALIAILLRDVAFGNAID